MEYLKRCPFCGGFAYVDSYPVYDDLGNVVYNLYGVVCTGCSANLSYVHESEESAISMWNKRAEK